MESTVPGSFLHQLASSSRISPVPQLSPQEVLQNIFTGTSTSSKSLCLASPNFPAAKDSQPDFLLSPIEETQRPQLAAYIQDALITSNHDMNTGVESSTRSGSPFLAQQPPATADNSSFLLSPIALRSSAVESTISLPDESDPNTTSCVTPLSETLAIHTIEWALTAFDEGKIATQTSKAHWVSVLCPECSTWIGTGQKDKGNLDLGSYPRFFSPLVSHLGGAKCKRARTKTPASNSSASTSISTLTPALTTGTSSPFTPAVRSSPLTPGAICAYEPSSTRLPSLPPCPGISFEWLVEDGPYNQTFPLARIGDGPNDLPFWVETHGQADQKHFAWSKSCSGVSQDALGLQSCSLCNLIVPRVQELMDQAKEISKFTNHRFYSWKQLLDLLRDRTAELNVYKLKVSNSVFTR